MHTNAIEAFCPDRFVAYTVPSGSWPVVVVPTTATINCATVMPTAMRSLVSIMPMLRWEYTLRTSPEQKWTTTPFVDCVETG
jgi:hypothetical protein